MAQRINRVDITEKWRNNIDSAKILKKMTRFYDGDAEMTTNQIKVGEILLKKTMPDLTKSDVNNTGEQKLVVEIRKTFAE